MRFRPSARPIPRTAVRRGVSRRDNRKGIATVEVAICLPVLLALTFGTMDLCSLFFLRETATLAAYEGAREGVGAGSTNADASGRVTRFLDERNVTYTGNPCAFSGTGFDDAATLENVTITVTVPCDGNLLLPSTLYAGWNISASVTMRKEYENDEDE